LPSGYFTIHMSIAAFVSYCDNGFCDQLRSLNFGFSEIIGGGEIFSLGLHVYWIGLKWQPICILRRPKRRALILLFKQVFIFLVMKNHWNQEKSKPCDFCIKREQEWFSYRQNGLYFFHLQEKWHFTRFQILYKTKIISLWKRIFSPSCWLQLHHFFVQGHKNCKQWSLHSMPNEGGFSFQYALSTNAGYRYSGQNFFRAKSWCEWSCNNRGFRPIAVLWCTDSELHRKKK